MSCQGGRATQDVRALRDLQLPTPGEYRLQLWLEDAAGNQREANAAVSVPLRFDPDPPELSFAVPDADDPLRVAVNAHRPVVGTGERRDRNAGSRDQTWHGMATELQSSRLVAYVDDERFRNGLYEFRAHARDQAGNEASTATRSDGAAASLRLPARIDTRLGVGHPATTRTATRSPRQRISAPFGMRVQLTGRLDQRRWPADRSGVDREAFERASGRDLTSDWPRKHRSQRTVPYVLKAGRNREFCSGTAVLGGSALPPHFSISMSRRSTSMTRAADRKKRAIGSVRGTRRDRTDTHRAESCSKFRPTSVDAGEPSRQ